MKPISYSSNKKKIGRDKKNKWKRNLKITKRRFSNSLNNLKNIKGQFKSQMN